MKRYIRSNFLGPIFNLPSDDCKYVVAGCEYNYDSELYEVVSGLESCVGTVREAAQMVKEYLNSGIVDAVIVNGTLEFRPDRYWDNAEIVEEINSL